MVCIHSLKRFSVPVTCNLLALFHGIGESILSVSIVLTGFVLSRTSSRSDVYSINIVILYPLKQIKILFVSPFKQYNVSFLSVFPFLYLVCKTFIQTLPTNDYALPTSPIFPSSRAIYSHRWVKYPESCLPVRLFQVLSVPVFVVLLWIMNGYRRN